MDIALEGSTSNVPAPTIPELKTVFSKLQDVQLKAAKERVKASASSSGARRSRGRGRGQRGRTPDFKGKQPADSTWFIQNSVLIIYVLLTLRSKLVLGVFYVLPSRYVLNKHAHSVALNVLTD